MAADGTSFNGIAGPALDEPDIIALARAAAAIAIGGDRVIRRGWVRIGRDHVEQVRARVESAAAQIVRDYLEQTPRGLRRAANQRRTGADPAGVLDPARLAAVVANALRDARPRERPSRRKPSAEALAAATTAEECGIKPLPAGDRGDPGLCSAKHHDAAEIEIADSRGDPLLWLLALDAAAAAEAQAEWRCLATLPAPRPRPRRPRPILHLRRAAAGGAT